MTGRKGMGDIKPIISNLNDQVGLSSPIVRKSLHMHSYSISGSNLEELFYRPWREEGYNRWHPFELPVEYGL